MNEVSEYNARVWDRMVAQKSGFASTVSARVLNDPQKHINIYNWVPEGVHGKKVLCLAAGGGKHAPLYAAAGAVVTVLDVSESMLEKDRAMAEKHGFQIRRVRACMTRMDMFESSEFDLIMQPVSSCYVENLSAMYGEVHRILKPGGIYIVQHKQPFSLQCGAFPEMSKYYVETKGHHKGPLPPVQGSEHREQGALEFLHPLEALLGGLCQKGFVIEDVREPWHGREDAAPGTFAHRSHHIPPYVALKARKRIDSGIAISTVFSHAGSH
jgi:SAM-dependent methyltransferase